MYIALLCKHYAGGHASLSVSKEIKERIREEYGLAGENILDNVWTVTSDTTAAARNVANHFQAAAQVDCVMHGGNFGLKYAMGISENYCNIDRQRVINTPGSNGVAFTTANEAIKKLKALIVYLGTPQRRDYYRQHAESEGFIPYSIPALPGDTRVASYCRMIQQCVFNFKLLQSFLCMLLIWGLRCYLPV